MQGQCYGTRDLIDLSNHANVYQNVQRREPHYWVFTMISDLANTYQKIRICDTRAGACKYLAPILVRLPAKTLL